MRYCACKLVTRRVCACARASERTSCVQGVAVGSLDKTVNGFLATHHRNQSQLPAESVCVMREHRETLPPPPKSNDHYIIILYIPRHRQPHGVIDFRRFYNIIMTFGVLTHIRK
uniref:Uncharacterized protein n=1 Tax=Schizaphis graminum TaxID=13262 RepID=A0A2S2PM31_SCHGA